MDVLREVVNNAVASLYVGKSLDPSASDELPVLYPYDKKYVYRIVFPPTTLGNIYM